MGSHVSAVPNHQTGRITPLKIRGDAAMSGNFGYELDLSKLSDIDKAEIKEQVEFYKEIRPLIQSGDFYRLMNPFESNNAAWMFVSKDKTDVMVAYFRILSKPNSPNESLKLKGLCPEMDYMLVDTQEVYGGDELMYAGLNIPDMTGDFQSKIWRFNVKN
jgi:alpha-galactosidase